MYSSLIKLFYGVSKKSNVVTEGAGDLHTVTALALSLCMLVQKNRLSFHPCPFIGGGCIMGNHLYIKASTWSAPSLYILWCAQ